MNPKDLLDIDKMIAFEEEKRRMEKVAVKEVIKQTKPQDNFSSLNKLDQEKGIEDWDTEGKEDFVEKLNKMR